MALYHVHASVISKGKSPGGATGFAQYIAREGQEKSTQMVRYVTRDGSEKDDLVAKGHGGLPAWAEHGSHFFLMADRYERQGGVLARCYEMALPRELPAAARLELAADIRATFFEPFPHVWAVHNPIDAQGQEHPHMHLMFSERRMTDGIARSPKRYFARAAAPGQDPAAHGVRKDRSWQGPDRLRDVRQGIATLTNAALERAGLPVAVSHESLRTRGQGREAVIYTSAQDQARVEAQRAVLHREVHSQENASNLMAWQAQKVREQLTDLRRDAMVDHVSNAFWRRDLSPGREQERQASIERRMLREHARTGRPVQEPRARPQDMSPRQPPRETPGRSVQVPRERPRPRQRTPVPWQGLLAVMACAKAVIDAEQSGGALRVQLYRDTEQEKDRGLGW